MERFQNARGVGDDEKRAVRPLAEQAHALADSADRVDVEAGVGLIENRELGLEHEHLQNFGLFLLAAGKAHVQVTLGIALVHMQKRHGLLELFLKVPQPQTVAGLLLERAADERAQRYAGDLQRILEGEENAFFRPLVDGERGDILTVEQNRACGDAVGRIAGDGVAERRLAGAVRSHENMGLVLTDGQIHAVQDLLFLDPHVQVTDLQKCLTHINHLIFVPYRRDGPVFFHLRAGTAPAYDCRYRY